MKPELHAVLLEEALLIALAQRHHLAHVDFVEGREDRGGLLRLDQALGDGPAQRRHRHDALARAVEHGDRRGSATVRDGEGPARRRSARVSTTGSRCSRSSSARTTSWVEMRPPRPSP